MFSDSRIVAGSLDARESVSRRASRPASTYPPPPLGKPGSGVRQRPAESHGIPFGNGDIKRGWETD